MESVGVGRWGAQSSFRHPFSSSLLPPGGLLIANQPKTAVAACTPVVGSRAIQPAMTPVALATKIWE